MKNRPVRDNAMIFAVGFLALAISSSATYAQSTPPSPACFVEPAKLSDAEVNAFLASPQALLARFASGGLPLSNQVRSLAGSSSSTLPALIDLASSASPMQAAAIGAGLARAARACAAVNPEFAAQIQAAIATANNSSLETAFAASSNDTQTAALGGAAPAAAGGGGAIGGGGTPGGGANGAVGGSSSTTSGTSGFSSGASGSYFATSGAGSSTIVPVSP